MHRLASSAAKNPACVGCRLLWYNAMSSTYPKRVRLFLLNNGTRKRRKSTGKNGEPCGSPHRNATLSVTPVSPIANAMRLPQKLCTQVTIYSPHPCDRRRLTSRLCCTTLKPPRTSIVTRAPYRSLYLAASQSCNNAATRSTAKRLSTAPTCWVLTSPVARTLHDRARATILSRPLPSTGKRDIGRNDSAQLKSLFPSFPRKTTLTSLNAVR